MLVFVVADQVLLGGNLVQVLNDDNVPMRVLVDGHDDVVLAEQIDVAQPSFHAIVAPFGRSANALKVHFPSTSTDLRNVRIVTIVFLGEPFVEERIEEIRALTILGGQFLVVDVPTKALGPLVTPSDDLTAGRSR